MTDVHAEPQLISIDVRNPADGSAVGSAPVDTPDHVAAKAAQLRRYQPEWEALGARGKADEPLWYPYSRREFRIALGPPRAGSPRDHRRIGLTPKDGRK